MATGGDACLNDSSSSEEDEARLARREQLLLRHSAALGPLVAPPRFAEIFRSSGRWVFPVTFNLELRPRGLTGLLSAPSSSVQAVDEPQGGGGASAGRSGGDTGDFE